MSIWYDKKGKPHKITNIMADGRIVDDLTGYKIPRNEQTAGIYYVFDMMCEKYLQKKLAEREAQS